MTMYPELGPVEVGEWLRYESSGDPDHYFLRVSRLTKNLIWVDDFNDDGAAAFSREHGALFVVGMFDAYAGRVRKLADADRADPKYLAAVGAA